MRPTPLTYQKPEIRAERAVSHFCEATGTTEYVDRLECPYCNDTDEEGEEA